MFGISKLSVINSDEALRDESVSVWHSPAFLHQLGRGFEG